MTEQEFEVLSLADKWHHIVSIMDYISTTEKAYSLRRRYNTHHPKEQVLEERRNMRVDQYQRWSHVKSLYAMHRDDMANTLENDRFSQCKTVLEKVFTAELDDALRAVVDEE